MSVGARCHRLDLYALHDGLNDLFAFGNATERALREGAGGIHGDAGCRRFVRVEMQSEVDEGVQGNVKKIVKRRVEGSGVAGGVW